MINLLQAGTCLIALSREKYIDEEDVKSVTIQPPSWIISIRNKEIKKRIVIGCMPEIFERVTSMISKNV